MSENKMTEERCNERCHTWKVLCNYCMCSPDDCKHCSITQLLRDTPKEARDSDVLDSN